MRFISRYNKLLVLSYLFFLRYNLAPASKMDRDIIGGGSINEKPRLYNPFNNLQSASSTDAEWDPDVNISHMLHAIVGLDRYPNYLSRFHDMYDIVALEKALKQTLKKVEVQKMDIINRRKSISDLVCYYNKKLNSEERLHNSKTAEIEEMAARPDDSEWRSNLTPPKTWSELKRRSILHDHAFKAAFQSMMTNPQHFELEDLLNGNVFLNLNASLLQELMEQEMFDVYSFPLLSKEVRSLSFKVKILS